MTSPSKPSVRKDVPVPSAQSTDMWASDAIVEMLRALEIPFVVLNPGASFRGIHDSLVNHLGNTTPQILLVLHEEHAVAIAHGYAKVTGKPLAAFLHSTVGLMHGSMAIFNAWADRVPVIVLGATGPVDAAKRRPWIDWLHTAQDQGALVRDFIKWDAQPASVAAAQEALLRANQISLTSPCGPTYVCFDSALQESKLSAPAAVVPPARFRAPPPVHASPDLVREVASLLSNAKAPVILTGRVSRDEAEWAERVRLAEMLKAPVITDLKVGAAFPTAHPLHTAIPGFFLSPEGVKQLREADVVLSLEWVDLAGTLKQAWGTEPVGSQIIQVSVDHYIHRGWSQDHQSLPPSDFFFSCDAATVVGDLLAHVTPRDAAFAAPAAAADLELVGADGSISVAGLAHALKEATAGHNPSLLRLPLGWSGEMWDFQHPLDYLGYDGGAGIGSGPGMAVGSALALMGRDRLPVAVLGDGDFMMGVSAFWTSVNARIPLLTLVCNNRSFFNDEVHQERVAQVRNRPVENRWIGQRIGDPEPDLATIARGQGQIAFGPIRDLEELRAVLAEAVEAVLKGESVVVDVHVTPGYSKTLSTEMTRGHEEG